MILRVLEASDAEAYRSLRLEALRTNPEAYGSTYEREAAYSLATMTERVTPTPHKFTLGAFEENESLIGIATFVRETSAKTAHKGNVYGMYVSPGSRGRGTGYALMTELIRLAAGAQEGLEQINLTVVSANLPAKKLYQAIGFTTYGVERRALQDDGVYYDEDLMVYFT